MGLIPGVRNNGVILAGLAALPGSTQMLVVTSAGVIESQAIPGGGGGGAAADMVVSNVSTDSGNKYYGGLVGAAWKINRYSLTTFVKTSATIDNNPSMPDLATAWTDRLSLNYA
jgi:hypothetical protein